MPIKIGSRSSFARQTFVQEIFMAMTLLQD
jgi:hypothetical protein